VGQVVPVSRQMDHDLSPETRGHFGVVRIPQGGDSGEC